MDHTQENVCGQFDDADGPAEEEKQEIVAQTAARQQINHNYVQQKQFRLPAVKDSSSAQQTSSTATNPHQHYSNLLTPSSDDGNQQAKRYWTENPYLQRHPSSVVQAFPTVSSTSYPSMPCSPPIIVSGEASKYNAESMPAAVGVAPSPDNKYDKSDKITDRDITDFDVLCGRGGGTNNHMGNRNFRVLVSQHQPQYVVAKKAEKTDIARTIVSAIRSAHPTGGRFLKKNEQTGFWYDVGDKKATEKTSQALREGLASKMRHVLSNNEIAVNSLRGKVASKSNKKRSAEDNSTTEAGHVHLISPPPSGKESKRRKTSK